MKETERLLEPKEESNQSEVEKKNRCKKEKI